MIIDFARFYPTFDSFFDFNSVYCDMCDRFYTRHINNYNRLYCMHCKIQITLSIANTDCYSVTNLKYKGFEFCYTHSPDTLYIRNPDNNLSYRWNPLTKETSCVSLIELKEFIESGEAEALCDSFAPEVQEEAVAIQ